MSLHSFVCTITWLDANKGQMLFQLRFGQHGFWRMESGSFRRRKFRKSGWSFSGWGSFHILPQNFITSAQLYPNCHVSQTYVTTGIEQPEKTLKSMALQSGSQQQLTSHCAGDRSQPHKAATTETRGEGRGIAISRWWLPPATAMHHKSISHKRPFDFCYCTLGQMCEVKISQFEHATIWGFPKAANGLTHLESCLCPTYKDSDLVNWLWDPDTRCSKSFREMLIMEAGLRTSMLRHLPDCKNRWFNIADPQALPLEILIQGKDPLKASQGSGFSILLLSEMSPAALKLSPYSQAAGRESNWLRCFILGVLEISLVIETTKRGEV